MIEKLLKEMLIKFNERAKTDQQLREELVGFERAVLIILSDGRKFSFRVSGGQAVDFQERAISNPDITIGTDTETIDKLVRKELRIMKALATRKLKIDASLEDMLRLRKFF